ncbi:hypothetical protein HK104_007694, partial [Borealophlyctis nickersoniae]
AGSLATEFVGPAITSPAPIEAVKAGFLEQPAEWLAGVAEPHLKYVDLKKRGYMVVTVGKEEVGVEYWYVRDVRKNWASGGGKQWIAAALKTE